MPTDDDPPAGATKPRAKKARPGGEPAAVAPPAARLERPGVGAALVAPLVAALGGEVEGLAPREVLSDATRLSGAVRELTRSLGVDVATVEFGSRWELEAAGVVLDWSAGFPPRAAAGAPVREPAGGRAPALLDAIDRVATVLGEAAVVAASVTGPVAAAAELAAASAPAPGVGAPARHAAVRAPPAPAGGHGAATPSSTLEPGTAGDVRAAARLALAAVRALCEAGARLIWLVEDGARPPADAAALAQALTPVLGTVRFYRATPALHLAGAADPWLDAVKRLRQAVPCFDPARSPALAAEFAGGRRAFGVLAAPGDPPHALSQDPSCVLVAHDGELAGRVPARELQSAVRALRPA
jgi:hypothetical protein